MGKFLTLVSSVFSCFCFFVCIAFDRIVSKTFTIRVVGVAGGKLPATMETRTSKTPPRRRLPSRRRRLYRPRPLPRGRSSPSWWRALVAEWYVLVLSCAGPCCPVLSCPLSSSCPFLACHVPSFPVLCGPVLSFSVLFCFVLTCIVRSCRRLSAPVLTCTFVWASCPVQLAIVSVRLRRHKSATTHDLHLLV